MGKGLFIEPLMEELTAAYAVTEAERVRAQNFGSVQRRREYLTWRAVVRRELGDVEIGYNEAGAPVVLNRNDIHIGVSHCRGWVAVCISTRPCAVDIEPATRNFEKAASHYLRPQERALSLHPLLPGVVWCAKETLYKYAGRTGLDLRNELLIEYIDFDRGEVRGRIKEATPIGLTLRMTDDLIVVYIL